MAVGAVNSHTFVNRYRRLDTASQCAVQKYVANRTQSSTVQHVADSCIWAMRVRPTYSVKVIEHCSCLPLSGVAGGVTMACVNKKCACITVPGKIFVASTVGAHAHARRLSVQANVRFPTCVRQCPAGELTFAGDCLSKKALNDKCVRDEQCPTNSQCYFGEYCCWSWWQTLCFRSMPV
jgi:hypothetical protein